MPAEALAEVTPAGSLVVLPVNEGVAKLAEGGRSFEVRTPPRRMLPSGRKLKVRLYKPRSIRFGAFLDIRLRFRHAIQVDISRSRGTVVAMCKTVNEFGYGPTLGDALMDLGKTLSELYFKLSDETIELGNDLQRVRERLVQFVELRPTA